MRAEYQFPGSAIVKKSVCAPAIHEPLLNIKRRYSLSCAVSLCAIITFLYSGAVAQAYEAKRSRNADMIDLVGVPRREDITALEGANTSKKKQPLPDVSAEPSAAPVFPTVPAAPAPRNMVPANPAERGIRSQPRIVGSASQAQPQHARPAIAAALPAATPPLHPVTSMPLQSAVLATSAPRMMPEPTATALMAASVPTPPMRPADLELQDRQAVASATLAPQAAANTAPQLALPDIATPAPTVAALAPARKQEADPVVTGSILPAVKALANVVATAPMPVDARNARDVEDGNVDVRPRARRIRPQVQTEQSHDWDLPRAQRGSDRPAAQPVIAPQAGNIPGTKISYYVRSQPLDQVLREIGQMAGVRIVPGAGVRGTIRDDKIDGPANIVLDRLSRQYGLFLFSDGGTIYADPVDENKSKFFRVRNSNAGAIDAALTTSGLSQYQDRVQPVGNEGLVRATGSDSFLKMVETVLSGMETSKTSVQLIKFGYKVN